MVLAVAILARTLWRGNRLTLWPQCKNGTPRLYDWTGGLLGASFILLTIFVPKKLGFALFSAVIVSGQLCTANAMDHVGFYGMPVHRFSLGRAFGLTVTLAGAVLNVVERANTGDTAWYETLFLCLASFFGGGGLVLQTVLNSRLARIFGQDSLQATLASFVVGTAGLGIASAIVLSIQASNDDIGCSVGGNDCDIQWWMFVGGPTGILLVGGSVVLSRFMGVAAFYVSLVAGQLLSALIFDEKGFYGFDRTPATTLRIIGVVMVFLGCAIVQYFKASAPDLQVTLKASGTEQRRSDV